MKASHKLHTQKVGFQEIEVFPGQFIFGRKVASEALNISEQTIRTCMEYLKKSKNITIKSTNKFSIITIVNWDTYQTEDEKTTIKSTNDQPTTNQQLTTNKNVKNVKEKYIYPDWLNLELWSEFKNLRIKLKKPLTEYAEKLAVNSLKKIIDSGETQESILNRTIQNGWKGFYPANGGGYSHQPLKKDEQHEPKYKVY